jgi:hypothetical protein
MTVLNSGPRRWRGVLCHSETEQKNRTKSSHSTARSGISQNSYRRFHRGKTAAVAVPQIFAGMDVFGWAWDVIAEK